ncbi:hypothetical protein R5R35_000739 [Gryllus longicercus]|uniref:Suppressor of cytokine signaling 7 n=2 Tax=Gryllus TaxID=6998 RepID=A0AAN9VXB2_9ORTH
MESPPACSTWSEAFPSSEDSGLLLTSGHSGSVSSGSCAGALALEEESDDDGKSLSTPETLSDGAADDDDDENFNTLKKGPGWPTALAPPPEFQDQPSPTILQPLYIQKFASRLVAVLLEEALLIACKATWSIHCSQECHPGGVVSILGEVSNSKSCWSGPRLCWTPELPPASANPANARLGSHSSLASSRLSSSHNSLAVPVGRGDDSSAFITSAMSHDDISDLYNVPFDSDIYAVPVDVVRPQACIPPVPPQRPRRHQHHHHHHHHRKRRRHASSGSQSELERQAALRGRAAASAARLTSGNGGGSKRHSVPSSVTGGSSARQVCSTSSTEGGGVIGCTEPVHMTLHEVRQYLQNLYSSSSDSIDNKSKTDAVPSVSAHKPGRSTHSGTSESAVKSSGSAVTVVNNNVRKHKKNTFVINIKNKKAKELCDVLPQKDNSEKDKVKKSTGRHSFSSNLKQTLCSIFRIRKPLSPDHHSAPVSVSCTVVASPEVECQAPKAPFLMRALPPLPAKAVEQLGGSEEQTSPEPVAPMPSPEEGPSGNFESEGDLAGEELSMDFAASIEKVKDYGWYWGPISGEAAEKVLSNEPDGSFIVRDSSDDHYIFSLTFKLNGCIRHVRIEHDQGNFSFGSCTKFKSHTIVDFIENAVEHSRSGRYLFFLHRRPVLGPMRVQLLHPVSRFKQVQSLQHMCRFVILKLVRRDLIPTLPLPRRLLDYLSTPHYYAEQLLEEEHQRASSVGTSPSVDGGSPAAAFLPPIFPSHLP